MSKVAILRAIVPGSLTLFLFHHTAYAGNEPIPYQTKVSIETPLDQYYPSSPGVVEIPIGNRLVVEHIAATAGIAEGQTAGCTVRANWSGAGSGGTVGETFALRLVLSDRIYQGGATDLLGTNQRVLLYADRKNEADHAIEVVCYSSSNLVNIGVTFTGYLIPLKTKR